MARRGRRTMNEIVDTIETSLRPVTAPRIALALGGGGARGYAHIVALEAFDELGIKPAMISGTSVGAVFGAAYASGMAGRDIRTYLSELVKDRRDIAARVLQARAGRIVDLFQGGRNSPVQLDPVRLIEQLTPPGIAKDFAGLEIPLIVVATDFWDRCEARFSDGPLVSAVGASMAIPSLFRPVVRDGRVLIDGGAVNPLPFDVFTEPFDVSIAVDVIGGPVHDEARHPVPRSLEATFGTLQILMSSIASAKLMTARPDILIRPDIDRFKVLDFFKVPEILKASEPIRDEIKRKLDRIMATL